MKGFNLTFMPEDLRLMINGKHSHDAYLFNQLNTGTLQLLIKRPTYHFIIFLSHDGKHSKE